MITYADVQSIYRKEGNTPTLEQIPDDFYDQIPELLSKVDSEHQQHIAKFLGEICTKRRNKIILHALRMGDREKLPLNATSSEKKLYIEAVELIKRHSDLMLSSNLKKKQEEPEKKEEKKIKVRMLKPIPNIMGSDMKSYGPFKEDDVSELPESTALNLIKHESAKEFEEPASAAIEG